MTEPRQIRALIFDFDGLILETELPVFEAWRENYAAHGHDLALEIYAGCVGSDFGRFDPRSHLEGLNGGPIDWDHWDIERERRAHEKVDSLTEPLPGIRALLAEAAELDLPCAVASSSPRRWVERHLERLGLLNFFRFTRCLDDVSNPKPSPELFLAAAEGLGVAPGEALVFEDSLNGLNAARSAGSPCVIVPNPVTRHLDFSGAALLLETLAGKAIAEILDGINPSAPTAGSAPSAN